ncbi:MAG: alcohol dehydrogenase catalytic domain-containing protein [Phycisphaeraceae bacterium]|nr:alcohol dehydrogenase catalytic domain-containing protein [Phycisphaeraceae bacterium]
MRAIHFDGRNATLRRDLPDPEPQTGEALIRPLRMGVCSTDLEICRGYMGFTGVLGHEFVGIVEEVNERRKSPLVGKRVVGRINCVCRKCDMCRGGLPEHCRARTVLGISERDGVFADLFTLPAINLLEVPAGIDDDSAVFAEPLAAACQIPLQLRIEGRPFVTVLGDGRLGMLCAQVMSRLNATVRVVGKHPEKLALCEKWGIKHRLLDEVGLRQDQDIVVDCTGSAGGLQTAMGMVRPRGRIVLKTTVAPSTAAPRAQALGQRGKTKPDQPAQSVPIDLSPLVINEIQLIGSRCGPFPDALAAMAAGQVDVVSLISRRMRLSDGVEALREADKPGVIKVLIEP